MRRAQVLRRMREDARPPLQQKDVAEMLKVSPVTVSRWETGASAMKRQTVRDLVMLYMARGAMLRPDEAAAADIEIPVPTRYRAPGELGAYPLAPPYPDRSTGRVQTVFDKPSGEEGDDVAVSVIPDPAILEAQLLQMPGAMRLAEISGYNRAVLSMMRAIAETQQRIVDGMAPWVELEESVRGQPGDESIAAKIKADMIASAAAAASAKGQKASKKSRKAQ